MQPSVSESSSSSSEDDQNDPHDIFSRFGQKQIQIFDCALSEIKNGRKCSCWMWYVFPTPPWIVNGVERGSGMNQHYSLRSDEQAVAYLQWNKRVNLRDNYLAITTAARDQLKEEGQNIFKLVGGVDAPKFRSSITYFHKIADQIGDEELKAICGEVLVLLDEEKNLPRSRVQPKPISSSSSSVEEKNEPEPEVQPTTSISSSSEEEQPNQDPLQTTEPVVVEKIPRQKLSLSTDSDSSEDLSPAPTVHLNQIVELPKTENMTGECNSNTKIVTPDSQTPQSSAPPLLGAAVWGVGALIVIGVSSYLYYRRSVK